MWLVAAFALAGGLAQLVDGTLGMGFGVTSATVLLALGVAPATASAATHAAKLPTTLISGLSHWRVGNVDKGVFLRVAIPGAIGGFLGRATGRQRAGPRCVRRVFAAQIFGRNRRATGARHLGQPVQIG